MRLSVCRGGYFEAGVFWAIYLSPRDKRKRKKTRKLPNEFVRPAFISSCDTLACRGTGDRKKGRGKVVEWRTLLILRATEVQNTKDEWRERWTFLT